MCGIVGYIGREQAAPILLNGLGRLEYRGYDSAGICVAADGVLHVEKCKGRLANLEEKTEHGALLPARSASGTPAGPPMASRTTSTPTPI